MRQAKSACDKVAILAQKRALATSASDYHAKAVAWYNLGWAEYRAYIDEPERPKGRPKESSKKGSPKFLKACIQCFKRAIELEAGNAEFWNALGIVTTEMNPKVSQHAFIRSLYLNERNARVWTNLGTLYFCRKTSSSLMKRSLVPNPRILTTLMLGWHKVFWLMPWVKPRRLRPFHARIRDF